MEHRFFCINDGVPQTTVDFLSRSCARRGIEYREIDAPGFNYAAAEPLEPGDLLYRPAVSLTATRVEQFLFDEKIATFYARPLGVFFNPTTSPLLFQRCGLPIPRTYYCPRSDRELLRQYVDSLGGFPVVVKLLGYSSGVGVMRVDSYPSLFSVMDFALAQSSSPLLCAYVDEAVHWRLIVIGDRVVSAYRNCPEPDDFRTYSGEDPRLYENEVRPEMSRIAVEAVRCLEHEFGGVDILEHPSGRLYLLEANFPCYFATAQEIVGTDISGTMIDYLVEKSRRLNTST